MQHKIFCLREFIKTELATAVQRAFRLRFNIQLPTRKRICRWNHKFEQIGCLYKGKAPAHHVYQRRTWDEFKRVLSVAQASQPVERAENLEYRNQLSGLCWGAVYSSSHTAYNWYRLFESTFFNHPVTVTSLPPCNNYIITRLVGPHEQDVKRHVKFHVSLSFTDRMSLAKGRVTGIHTSVAGGDVVTGDWTENMAETWQFY